MDQLSQGTEQCRRYQEALIPVYGKNLSGELFIGTGLLAEGGRRPVIIAPEHGNTDPEQWEIVSSSERKSCEVLSTAPDYSTILDAPQIDLTDSEPISQDECGDIPELATEIYTLGFCGGSGHGLFQVRKGIVSTGGKGLICVSTFTVQANSGGPIWEAASGKLVGTIQTGYMATMITDDGEELNTNEDLTGAAPVADWTQVIW